MIIKYYIIPKTAEQRQDVIDYFSEFLELQGIDNWKYEVEDKDYKDYLDYCMEPSKEYFNLVRNYLKKKGDK
jgi:hypothetical protein